MRYYFHGSPTRVGSLTAPGILEPRPSAVVDHEPVVFATSSRAFAVVHLAKWTDRDLAFGRFGKDQPLVLQELYPGAFDRYKGVEGYLYLVDPKLFHRDGRAGMREEFISRKPVPIIATKHIKDVWTELWALQGSGEIVLVTFDEYAEVMYKYVAARVRVKKQK